jgi:tetratricopeptide (TPR) repeat protein
MRLTMLACLLAATPVAAQTDSHRAHAGGPRHIRVLGKIEFPTTTRSPEAQDAFLRGMLLLHLFEYPFAAREFQRAEQLDAGFVMAYWGEAMVYNHPIWDQQDRDKALAVLNKLGPTSAERAAKTSSQKEQDYVRGLEVLYGDGPKADRDRAYMHHMAQMAQRYPDDDEVRLFYALSIMGVGAGVRDIPSYMESAALSQSVFYAHRDHPGAAHYLIHAVDDPVHAPLGLEAARALAAMAPDAGHSLHMASHIFNALGMWNDVVTANTDAVRVANRMATELGRTARHWGHYNFWLLYSLLQQGRIAEAKQLLVQAYRDAATIEVTADDRLKLDPDDSAIGSLVQMWARYLFETGGSDPELLAWRFNMGDAFDPNLTYHYVLGLFASEPAVITGHLTAFRTLEAQLRSAIKALPRQAPYDLQYLHRLGVIEQELESALARAQNDTDGMIEHAREAARLEGEMPYSFGPPFVDYPAAQWLGERLLEAGDNDAAAQAFSEQLKRSRLKTQALLGLAHAERARGNRDAADFAMARYEEAGRVPTAH